MTSIRNRLIFIVFLVTLALVGLWPRQVSVGTTADGTDSTETQWGLKLGLDLQGGMHLAVEIDESGGPVTNIEDALARAETVIRSRIDEFGVAEPLIQKVGDDRIIIQLPGIDDPARAKEIVERSAFLEFRITDMQGEFEGALDRIDRALVRAGVTVGDDSTSAVASQSAIAQLLGAATDTTTQTGDSAAGADSVDVAPERPSATIFSGFLNVGQVPGEVFVVEEDVPRVTRLMEHPEFRRNVPRGIDLLWGREPMSLGGRLYRGLYAVASRPIITGERLSDAQPAFAGRGAVPRSGGPDNSRLRG